MKNISKISILFLSAITFTACSQTAEVINPSVTTQPAESSYENKELGIKFSYAEFTGLDSTKTSAEQEGNKIVFKNQEVEYLTPQYIEIFTKKPDQKIEDAILDVAKKENKDVSKCKVIDNGKYWAKESFENYKLELVDSKIVYTKDEEKEIAQANIEGKETPFDGEEKKSEIYNKRLIDTCSQYADPLGLGTSKTAPSIFLYDEKASNTKFIFVPGSADPYFFQAESLEILK